MSDQNTLLFITEADTVELLQWTDVIACLATAYAAADEPAAVPPRVVARRDGAWLRVLAAMPAGRLMGAKIIARARTPQLSYLMPLWDRETAELVCLLDAKYITGMRTAGTTAMAADRILPPGPLRVAVLGSSHEAQAHGRAIAAIRPITAMKVFSPTPASREAYAQKISRELGIACSAAATPREVQAKIEADIRRVLAMPEVKTRLNGAGLDITPSSPAEMTSLLRNDIEAFRRAIDIAGIKPE